jgi:predicted secreted protein
MHPGSEKASKLTRRRFLRTCGPAVALCALAKEFLFCAPLFGQSGLSGFALPDERVEATLKRLFGSRPLHPGGEKIKFELPLIAEDGGNVPIVIESNLPVTPSSYVKSLYVISDKNRRPLIAKFSFAPDVGKVYIATSIRLAVTTDVRAIAEVSDGTLYATSRNVRVTVSGCDLPPAS